MARKVEVIEHRGLGKKAELKLDIESLEFTVMWQGKELRDRDGDKLRQDVLALMESEESIEWEDWVAVEVNFDPIVHLIRSQYSADGHFVRSNPGARVRYTRREKKLWTPRPVRHLQRMVTYATVDEDMELALAALLAAVTNFQNHLAIAPERGAYWLNEIAERLDKVFAKEETDNGATAPPQQGGGA